MPRALPTLGCSPQAAGPAIEDGAEDARRVGPGEAQPLDVAARGNQCVDLAVGDERVVRDRRVRGAAMRSMFFCIDGHTAGNPVRLVAGGALALLVALAVRWRAPRDAPPAVQQAAAAPPPET